MFVFEGAKHDGIGFIGLTQDKMGQNPRFFPVKWLIYHWQGRIVG